MTEKNKQPTILQFFSNSTSRKRLIPSEVESELPQPSSSNIEKGNSNIENKKKYKALRKYDEGYLKFGFIQEPDTELEPRPLCVVCSESLSNDAMKPSKLNKHLQSKHPDLVKKPIEYFQRKRESLQKQMISFERLTIENKSLLKASYLVAFQIATKKKPYTIGEDLIKPCLLEVCEEVLGRQSAQKLKEIPMSANTVKRRIKDMAEDIEIHVVEMVKSSTFYSIQLDESTDISNEAIVLCFVRFEHQTKLYEELLCSLNLPGRTTSSEIFNLLNSYFLKHGIEWKKCIGVCTDGAANMTGCRSGVITKIKDVAHADITLTHCIIHREHLAAKRLSPGLYDVISDVIKIVNEIRHKALNSRLFQTLCEEMGSGHTHLLLHAEVRWLSRGKVLTRLFELRQEIKLFFQQQNITKFQNIISNNDWLAKLAYLADIFSLLNELNKSLQGQLTDVFILRSKMDAFQRKILLWQTRLAEEDLQMFPNLDEYMKENDVNREIINLVEQHLKSLTESFARYYPKEEDPRIGNMWIINPFSTGIEDNVLNMNEKENLIELATDDNLKVKFHSSPSRFDFWLSVKTEYPVLSEKAIKILIPFATTYLCEKTFSAVTAIKTKYRCRLEIEAALRVAVTSLEPRIYKLISDKQQQMSH